MIQRKQTLYLFIAVIISIINLLLPLGMFVPQGMGVASLLFNIGIKDAQGAVDFVASPLSILLSVNIILSVFAIAQYKKRMFQAKLCILSMCLYITWYAYLIFILLHGVNINGDLQMNFNACLPLVALILTFMARKGVLADEKLIKSMDRIR